MSDVLVVIPSRLGSTRLAQKPLADIGGKPLVLHAWHHAMKADVGDVVVACCSEKVADIVTAAGGKAVLTDPALPSGSDRVHAAAQAVGNSAKIIVNLQGDLPSIRPETVRGALRPLQDPNVDIGTVAAIMAPELRDEPGAVSIATHLNEEGLGRALYFSRAPIPWGDGPLYHHIGLYAYRREALDRFVSLPPSPLEKRESLEQLRALEAGLNIGVSLVEEVPLEVNTPEDLERVRSRMAD
ncbi:MAG: 3-deoxy-manno-octulosonate cytidylyltransferase [bacterium]|nr:3-deoxy-manno-octulosonate cytidylyltransferase [bacterium]